MRASRPASSSAPAARADAAIALLTVGDDAPADAVSMLEGRPDALRGPEARLELAEAYTLMNRMADATAALEPALLAMGRYPAHLALPLARVSALAGPPDDAEARLRSALETASAGSDYFEIGRTQFRLGCRLRESGNRAAARTEFRAAREAFGAVGAKPWLVQAERELQRSGGGRAEYRAPRGAKLNARELNIVASVIAGSSNREIADELYLSVKSIEYHLGKVYRKLGVTSRAELIKTWAADAEELSV